MNDKLSIEPHGKAFALYYGRGGDDINSMHHGLNLGYVTEPDLENFEKIEDARQLKLRLLEDLLSAESGLARLDFTQHADEIDFICADCTTAFSGYRPWEHRWFNRRLCGDCYATRLRGRLAVLSRRWTSAAETADIKHKELERVMAERMWWATATHCLADDLAQLLGNLEKPKTEGVVTSAWRKTYWIECSHCGEELQTAEGIAWWNAAEAAASELDAELSCADDDGWCHVDGKVFCSRTCRLMALNKSDAGGG